MAEIFLVPYLLLNANLIALVGYSKNENFIKGDRQ